MEHTPSDIPVSIGLTCFLPLGSCQNRSCVLLGVLRNQSLFLFKNITDVVVVMQWNLLSPGWTVSSRRRTASADEVEIFFCPCPHSTEFRLCMKQTLA